MAIPATQVWEVRPTNGTANAGGGFDPSVASPGTDYSQQDAVQIAYTDLVIGGTTTRLTSAGNAFTSAHVGNTIAITGGTGFTTGLYSVRSVSGSAATMDRSVGTGGSTGGTGNLGGARSGFTVGTTTLQASLVAGNKTWVKNEAWNEAVSFTVAGSTTQPMVIEGYNTSRGDVPTGSSRPVNNRASAAGDGITLTVGNYRFYNIMVTAAGDAGVSTSSSIMMVNCRLYGNTGEGFEPTSGGGHTFINCEFDTNGTQGVGGTQFLGTLLGCYSHDNTGGGTTAPNSQATYLFCIFEANSAYNVSEGGGTLQMLNCTVNGAVGATADGVIYTNNGTQTYLYNNIFSNNGRYGVNGNDVDGSQSNYNDFFGNTTAARNNFVTGPNDLALDPTFTNAGAGDFSIGTNLKAAGFPGTFPAGLSTGYLDIGAVQRQESGGGGLAANPLRGFL